MNKAPWLSKKSLQVVDQILRSYERAFKERLLSNPKVFESELQKGELIFCLHNPILAHDTKKDPCLKYANATALRLWNRTWEEMIGMPSRLTAPTSEHQNRRLVLKQAITKHAIKNYHGLRVNKHGENFMIANVRIWTIWDQNGSECGQAATFDSWWRI